MTMAIQAPLHVQGLCLPREWHFVDTAVTGFATNPLMYMDAVVEVHEIRNVVNTHPLQWTVVAKARANRLQGWAIRPNLLVAVHAYFRRGNAGK